MTDEYGILDIDEKRTPSRLDDSHPDQADAISMPKDVRQKPGAIHTNGSMLLHTKQAHRLFYGRRRNEAENTHMVVGLIRFAANVSLCWKAAEEDDPYADLALLNIETAYNEAVKSLDETQNELAELLESMNNIEINISQSIKPVEVFLSFSVPWGFRGANLLAKFDQIVKMGLSARHVGLLMDDESHRLLHSQRKLVRKVFTQSLSWNQSGVTRNDFAANNKVVQRAIEKHRGREIPADVLRGDRRAVLAPAIRINHDETVAI